MSKIRPTIFGLLMTVMVGAFIFGGVLWAEETAAEEAIIAEDMTKAKGETLSSAGDEPTTQPDEDEPAPQPGGAARKREEESEGGKEASWKEGLNWTIKTLDIVIACMGLLLVLIALIATGVGIYLTVRWRKWEKTIKQVKEDIKIIEKLKIKAENDVNSIKKSLEQLSPPSLTEEPDKYVKERFAEFSRRLEDLEIFGVSLNAEDYYNRGLDYYYKEQYESALKFFDKAIQLKSDYAEAWVGKGIALVKLERYEEALKAYNKVIELKPDDAEVWADKGATLAFMGRYEEALKAFDRAIELKPDLAEAWACKAVALVKLERYPEALEAYDKAIELNPDDASAWFNRACTRARMGDKDNALKDLAQAIKIDEKLKEKAKTEEDFKSLWDDPDFKKLVE